MALSKVVITPSVPASCTTIVLLFETGLGPNLCLLRVF